MYTVYTVYMEPLWAIQVQENVSPSYIGHKQKGIGPESQVQDIDGPGKIVLPMKTHKCVDVDWPSKHIFFYKLQLYTCM